MIKTILLLAALCAMALAGGGHYKVDYGFTAGGYGGHGGYGHGGHAKVHAMQDNNHYKFSITEPHHYHHQTAHAHTGYGHGGGGGGGGGYGY